MVLYQAGHIEKAIAIYQAQIELNCFHPPAVLTLPTAKDQLAQFWEGGLPRVGEEGAAGWITWVENRKGGDPPGTNWSRRGKQLLEISCYLFSG